MHQQYQFFLLLFACLRTSLCSRTLAPPLIVHVVLAYQQQNLILLTVPSHINIISVIYQFLGNKKKRSLRLKITLPALAGVAYPLPFEITGKKSHKYYLKICLGNRNKDVIWRRENNEGKAFLGNPCVEFVFLKAFRSGGQT